MSDKPERHVLGVGYLDWLHHSNEVPQDAVFLQQGGKDVRLHLSDDLKGRRYRLILEKVEDDKPAVPCWHGPNCDGRWINCHPANSIANGEAPT